MQRIAWLAVMALLACDEGGGGNDGGDEGGENRDADVSPDEGPGWSWGRPDGGQMPERDAAVVPQDAATDAAEPPMDGSTMPPGCVGGGELIEGRCAIAFESFACKRLHCCGLTADGTAYCVGGGGDLDGHGEALIDGRQPQAVKMPAGVTFSDLAVGNYSTCAVGSDGNTYCWGYVKLGTGQSYTQEYLRIPTVEASSPAFVKIEGWQHFCGIDAVGKIWCWDGSGSEVGLSDPAGGHRDEPQLLTGQEGLTFVDLSVNEPACAVTDTGAVYCWTGYNTLGLGDSPTEAVYVPTRTALPEALEFVQVDVADAVACARAATDEVYCWGRNDVGAATGGASMSFTDIETPIAVALSATLDPIDVATSRDSVCVLGADSAIECWGWNGSGHLGNGAVGAVADPTPHDMTHVFVQVPDGVRFTSITGAKGSSAGFCAISETKLVYCWGHNEANAFRDEDGVLPPDCANPTSGCIGVPTRLREPRVIP
jgi:alpha-tubulin suppressor-like RCC1 family protein